MLNVLISNIQLFISYNIQYPIVHKIGACGGLQYFCDHNSEQRCSCFARDWEKQNEKRCSSSRSAEFQELKSHKLIDFPPALITDHNFLGCGGKTQAANRIVVRKLISNIQTHTTANIQYPELANFNIQYP